MADIERILIVGGGIAGLSAAAALSRQGFSAELVERSATWPTIGAGINLPANGVRVLQALGLRAAAERNAAVVRRWGFFDQHGAALCETDLEDLWSEVGPSLAMTRVKLHEVLLAGAAAASRRLGVSLTALAQDDRRVRASFSDGASGDYDLVIGADGIHSTARRLVVGTYSPSYAGQLVWRSVVATRPQGIVDNIMVLMGEGRFFGLVPIGEGHTYGFGALNVEWSEDPLEGRLERFRRRFAEFATPVSAYLGHNRKRSAAPFWADRMGRSRRLASRPHGPHWRRGARRPSTHGRGRLHCNGGLVGAGGRIAQREGR
jgi:FAD-dependent urate hydroxylase